MDANEKLAQLREEIDDIDEQMVTLFSRRMAVSEEVARVKSQAGIATQDSNRERVVIEHALSLCEEKDRSAVASLMRTLMSLSRQRQNQSRNIQDPVFEMPLDGTGRFEPNGQTVAVPSGLYPFAEQAALAMFSNAVFVPETTVADVFLALGEGRANYGVVPVKNPTGLDWDLFGLLNRYTCHIVAQTGQVAETGFVAVSRELLAGEDSNKTRVTFVVPATSEALLSVLEPLSHAGIAMTRIDSRPEGEGKLRFLADLLCSLADEATLQAIRLAAGASVDFRILGCYVS